MPTELPTTDEPRPDRCETCRFWYNPDPIDEDCNSQCRARSPVRLMIDIESRASAEGMLCAAVWPETTRGDWCGEWKAKAGVIIHPTWETFIEGLNATTRRIFHREGIDSFQKLQSVDEPLEWYGFGETNLRYLIKHMATSGVKVPPQWYVN